MARCGGSQRDGFAAGRRGRGQGLHVRRAHAEEERVAQAMEPQVLSAAREVAVLLLEPELAAGQGRDRAGGRQGRARRVATRGKSAAFYHSCAGEKERETIGLLPRSAKPSSHG